MLSTTSRRRGRATRTGLPELRTEMDDLLSDFLGGGHGGSTQGRYTPATDLYETADAYVVEMEVPGFDRDDVEVSLEEGALTIRGRRDESTDGQEYRRRERPAGRFERHFRLPRGVETDGAEARLEKGLLHVRMPKAEKTRSRRIEVQAG